MELLGLLLYYYEELDSNDLCSRSDKDRITPYVYNFRILKQLLGHEFSYNLLFGHAFSGSNTSQLFGVGKKTIFHRVIKGNPLLRECSEIFCTAVKDLHSMEDHGYRLMVSLFNGTQSDSLESLRQCTVTKVATAKRYVKPERLPPSTSAAKFHCRRTYL